MLCMKTMEIKKVLKLTVFVTQTHNLYKNLKKKQGNSRKCLTRCLDKNMLLIRDIQKDIHEKQYNTGTELWYLLCNALWVKAVVCRVLFMNSSKNHETVTR